MSVKKSNQRKKSRQNEQFNHFFWGFLPGLLLPILFAWIYIARFYPGDFSFFEVVKQLFPSIILGKIMLLSIMPNLLAVFLFYKQDYFKSGIGVMFAALPYLLIALFML